MDIRLSYAVAADLFYVDADGILSYNQSRYQGVYRKRTSTPLVRVRLGTGRRYRFSVADLTWLLVTKSWPKNPIVFLDNDPTNTQIDNLLDGYGNQRKGYRPLFKDEEYRTLLLHRKERRVGDKWTSCMFIPYTPERR